jgi:hypothetical protein
LRREDVDACLDSRHCEERSDEAIHSLCGEMDCFASLAMTVEQAKRLFEN